CTLREAGIAVELASVNGSCRVKGWTTGHLQSLVQQLVFLSSPLFPLCGSNFTGSRVGRTTSYVDSAGTFHCDCCATRSIRGLSFFPHHREFAIDHSRRWGKSSELTCPTE